jgi:beta-lactam-binding protein with PASTA domain
MPIAGCSGQAFFACYSAVKTVKRPLIEGDSFSIAASTLGLAVLWHH